MAKKSEEVKYFERLDISILGIDKIKNLIKNNIKNTINCWSRNKNIERQTFHIIGPAGVGKTESCKQIAKELTEELQKKFDCIIIKAPVISRDDLLCPFPEINNGATKFKMLYSDFIPTDQNSYGIFVIDEFGRGDHQLQQLCWQIQNEQKIHIYNFPKGWFVISLDNPDDSEYSMDFLEDAAGLRRALHLYTDVSVPAFLNYAIKCDFHSYVIEFIQTHPEYLYDFESQKLGRVYANPASWERVSNILWGYENESELFKNILDIDAQCSGLLNNSLSRVFVDFMKNKDDDIKPKELVFNYKKEKGKIKKLLENSNNIKIGQLMNSFLTYLSTSKPAITKNELKNISDFLLDIPADIAATYPALMMGIKDRDSFLYLTRIQADLLRNDEYRTKFHDSMVDMSKRARE